jgi:hypothetical protein
LSCVTGDVLLLGASSIGGVGSNVTDGITSGVGSWIGCCISDSVDRLHDFILTTPLFVQGLKGSIVVVVTTMAGSLRPTPGVGTWVDLLYPGPLSLTWVVAIRM